MTTKEETANSVQCPECGTLCKIEFSGLDLVANTGDETLATKNYIPISLDLMVKKDALIMTLERDNEMLESLVSELEKEIDKLKKSVK
jgi:hypothetical protein